MISINKKRKQYISKQILLRGKKVFIDEKTNFILSNLDKGPIVFIIKKKFFTNILLLGAICNRRLIRFSSLIYLGKLRLSLYLNDNSIFRCK